MATTYLWCDSCKRSFAHADMRDGMCPICNEETRELGWMSAFVRGVMAQELVSSGLGTRHRTMIKLIWTANGMGERYYRVLTPEMPYNKFEARVTELLCRGAEEGWVRFVIPPAPRPEESAYKLEFDDEERFVRELDDLVNAGASKGVA